MSNSTPVAITAGLRPEFFKDQTALSRKVLIVALSIMVIAGFAFRVRGLASEGLSDDELNKLVAVNDYRAHGLTGANGEHPFVMKALCTLSLIASERWNQSSLAASHPDLKVPVEASLRLPGAIFGALTPVLIFLIASELFGSEVALIAAALWVFDPLALGFNRIAKEDTFLIFFFLLANLFWLRGQRVAESRPGKNAERYYWATAIALGAMMASKTIPMVISIPVAYNYIFQKIPATRWVIGKKRFIKFFMLMGLAFVVFSPTIFLPDTWKAMANFSNYRTMGHDSYEFIGRLYPHKFADWVRGEPWYFYPVLLLTKLPLLSLAAFVIGVVLLFRRKIGDGRYFLFVWLVLWGLSFMFVGGKFARYVTSLLPAVFMAAAIGIQFIARAFERFCAQLVRGDFIKPYARAAIPSIVIAGGLWAAIQAAPHYRLYANPIAGGRIMFPQDEFYDAYMQQTMAEMAKRAAPNARVASEIQNVADYYANRSNRPDLVCLELSDPADLKQLQPGDFVIDARGRTYFSNQAMLMRLRHASRPAFTTNVGTIPAADVYILDERSLTALRGEQRADLAADGGSAQIKQDSQFR
ncbi:MAG TPA: glycosyltransferase family 39 protein [Pyrinomonadaceae bacterium]